MEVTLTGRRAIRVSGAVHPGRPLLRALFFGDCVDGCVYGTSVGGNLCGVGDYSSSGADGGRSRVGGIDASLRVGARQIDRRTQRFGGGRRRGPSAAVGFLVIRRRRADRVVDGSGGSANRRISAGGVVTELVEMVQLIVQVTQTVDVVEVLLFLLLLDVVMVGLVVPVMAVVRAERRRRTADGRGQASGAATEFRSQYVVDAELQRTLGRTVQATAGSGLHSVVVVFGGRTCRLAADRLIAAPAVPAVQFHRLHGRRLGAHALLQTVGHHHRVHRYVLCCSPVPTRLFLYVCAL